MLSREEMIEKMEKAHNDKSYIFYKDHDFKNWSDEKVQDKYIDMINFQSDARTHTDW